MIRRPTIGVSAPRWIGTASACASVSPRSGEQRGGGVQPFLDDRREGAAHQRELHLVGDAVQLVAHHLQRDRIDPCMRQLRCRAAACRCRSTVPRPAGLHQRGGVGLLDDRRAGEAPCRRGMRGAIEDRGRRPASRCRRPRGCAAWAFARVARSRRGSGLVRRAGRAAGAMHACADSRCAAGGSVLWP